MAGIDSREDVLLVHPDREQGFRPELQGLRAWAVMLVVAFHVLPEGVPAGYIGVDVFFVLSGYLITGLLLRDYRRSGRIHFGAFYLRRLKRLFPALILVLFAGNAIAWLVLSPGEYAQVVKSTPFAAFWISNFYFTFQAAAYFNELGTQDLFLHTWSLGLEEQFYLVWPWFLLLLLFLSQRLGRSWFPVVGLSVVVGWSLLLSGAASDDRPLMSFYLLPTRAWQFGLGALVVFLARCQLRRQAGEMGAIALRGGGLMLILAAAFLIPRDAIYPGFWSLLPSLGAVAVILGDHSQPRRRLGLLGQSALVWLGDRSYAIYLWHFPLIGLVNMLVPETRLIDAFGLILLTLLLAHLSYSLVELPFWRGRYRELAPRPALLGVIALALAASTGSATLAQRAILGHELAQREAAWRSDVPPLHFCDSWYRSADLEPCIFGRKEASPERTIVLLGDSIGVQWFSLFDKAYADKGWRLVVLTKSACPMVDAPYYYERIRRRFRVCEQWRQAAIEWIAKQEPAWLVLGSSLDYPLSRDTWTRATRRLLQALAPSVGRITLLMGTPGLGFDGPGCVARSRQSETRLALQFCTADYDWQTFDQVKAALQAAVLTVENAQLVDLSTLVCPRRQCSAVWPDGQVVFRDSQHLRDSFVRDRVAQAMRLLDGPAVGQRD